MLNCVNAQDILRKQVGGAATLMVALYVLFGLDFYTEGWVLIPTRSR